MIATRDAAADADADGAPKPPPDALDAAPEADAPDPPDGAAPCAYLDDPRILHCADAYEYARVWTDVGDPVACPPFVLFRGLRYADLHAAAAAQGCDPMCLYRPGISVSYLHCGSRNGYIVYQATACPDVYEFAEGLYLSVEAHEAAHPCPP